MKKILLITILCALFSTMNFAEQIYIKAPVGKRITLDVNLKDTIAQVKEKIYDHEGISLKNKHLPFLVKSLMIKRL